MSKVLFYLLVFAAMFILPATAFALDIICLEDGTRLEGYIVALSEDKTMFYFQPEDKEEEPSWVSISDIASIEFGASIIIRDSNRAAPQKEEKPQDKENEKTGVAPFSFPKK